ncbi:hypothetical protein IAT38_005011 [Cryptococcus sp. DSM 104549]
MRPIVRFTQAPLTRGISTTAPALGLKKKTSLTAARKQGFSKKKRIVPPGFYGGGGGTIKLKFGMPAPLPDLSDLPRLELARMRPEFIGKPATFSKGVTDKLKVFGIPPKIDTELANGGGAASVLREATVDLVSRMEKAKDGSSKDARYILTGEKGSGKSMLLLQAVSCALTSGWIVLYIPRATTLVDSSSHYVHNPETQVFDQWQSAQSILTKLVATNGDKLEHVKLAEQIDLGRNRVFAAGKSVRDVAQAGVGDVRVAVKALDSVISALEAQTQYPVLWAIDEAQALFAPTMYRAPDFTPLEPYHLSTTRMALDFIAGRRTFARGTVLTAISYADPLHLPSLSLRSALSLSGPVPLTPYTPLNQYHVAHASELTPIAVPKGFTAQEATGLFLLFSKKGWAPGGSDELFMEAFVASGGNPLMMAKGIKETMLALTD